MDFSGAQLKGSDGLVWKLSHMIGKGSCCEVYRASSKTNNLSVAVKVFKVGFQYSEAARREKDFLKQVENEDFVHIHDYFTHGERACLVMEFCDGHMWHIIAKNQNEGLSFYLIQMLARDIIRSLCQLHDIGIVHGDIKPANLIWSPNASRLRLIDFSLSFDVKEKDIRLLQTKRYRAPEVEEWNNKSNNDDERDSEHAEDHLGTAMDIWSVGCVLMEMFMGRKFDKGAENLAKHVHRSEMALSPEQILARKEIEENAVDFDDQALHDFSDLVYKCLSIQPEERISAAEMMKHTFFESRLKPSFLDLLLLPTCVLRFMNVLEDIDLSDESEMKDMIEEVIDECENYGQVLGYECPKQGEGKGKLFVSFASYLSSETAYTALSKRTFNDRTVLLTFYPVHLFNKSDFL